MTVLIAIPYWTTAEPYIDDAVTSALAQDEDVVVLVAGDGAVPPVTVRDDRLVLLAFSTNEGAPSTQQAMLLGSPFGWYAPMGADDRIDPEYVPSLLDLGGKANASHSLWHFDRERMWQVTDSWANPAHAEFGVFDADLLRSVGGYGADRRCGQDTLLYLELLPHVTQFAWLDEPLYYKRVHAASLTHSPETGHGSPYREEVVARNAEIAWTCQRWQGDLPRIRAFREGLLTPEQRETLDARVAMVREALA